ncbi:hypothetical protein C8R45DRAFT_1084049 [Mycena sanguinolenta]|nr:hypothetical protein C8R45DRAFT_1084049 [Mycena sanguinolenta]
MLKEDEPVAGEPEDDDDDDFNEIFVWFSDEEFCGSHVLAAEKDTIRAGGIFRPRGRLEAGEKTAVRCTRDWSGSGAAHLSCDAQKVTWQGMLSGGFVVRASAVAKSWLQWVQCTGRAATEGLERGPVRMIPVRGLNAASTSSRALATL